jgi:hypothetical protein
MKYITNNLIAFDQQVNTLLAGDPDETISARCYRNREKPGWRQVRLFVDTLFFWQRNHCQKSYIAEVKRKQLPKDYR